MSEEDGGRRGQAPTWARAATTTVFFAQGALFASWTAHIPHVKAHLQLGNGALGFALLGAPVGSVAAMLLSAYLLPRLGSRRLVQIALAGYCAAGPFVGLTGSLGTLFVALLAWGAFQGALDVAMNTQAIAVEHALRRPLMPGFHGSWSLGAFAGAAAGAGGVALGVSLSVQLLALATPAVAVCGLLSTRMLADERIAAQAADEARPRGRLGAPLRTAVLVLGAIALADMLCEGAAADWAAVYLRTSLHTSAALAGLGYGAYSLAMVAVRLCGNRLLARFRAERLLPALAVLAAAGLAAALALATPASALLGFACLGAGAASVIPVVFGAAGRIPALHAGTAVAAVSGFGWVGFVIGPPLIGQLAAATSLRTALLTLPVLMAIVAAASASTRALRTARP